MKKALHTDFKAQIQNCSKQADVLNLKSQVLGKKGALSEILKSLKDATVEERKEIGPVSNKIKQDILLILFIDF